MGQLQQTGPVAGLRRGRSFLGIPSGVLQRLLGLFNFPTNQSAPLTSPYTEPGAAGSLTIVDTGNLVSIAGNKMHFAGITTPGSVPRAYSQAIERIAGRALYFKFNGVGLRGGWSVSTATAPQHLGLYFYSDNRIYFIATGWFSSLASIAYLPNGTEYECLVILRGFVATASNDTTNAGGGGFLLVKGGVYTDWTLIGFSNYGHFEPLYAMASIYIADSTTFDVAAPQVFDLAGVWATPYGKATLALPYPQLAANGVPYVITANAAVHVLWKPAAAEILDVCTRWTDDNNCWILRCNQAAGTATLIERVAGVETTRGTPVTGLTWNTAANYDLCIYQRGTQMAVMGGEAIITYASAASNQTSTGLKFNSSAVTPTLNNLESYPTSFPTLTLSASGPAPKHIFCVGDSKTNGTGDDTPPPLGRNGYPMLLPALLNTDDTGWYERPERIGLGGYTTTMLKAIIDAQLAAAVGTPDWVLYNMGANDTTFDATWQTNTTYILDAMHTKWPNARMLCAVTWQRSGGFTKSNLHRAALNTALASRSAWAAIGIDESVVLENGDDGVSRTTDGIHPNHAGYVASAVAWKTAMGF